MTELARNDEDLRLAIYQSFATTGRAPTIDDAAALARLAQQRHIVLDDTAALARLAQQRHIVLDDTAALARLAQQRHIVLDDAGKILLAHPFSSIPMGFSVMGQRTLWWGGCAWDSFALPHLLPDELRVLVATTCPACYRALAWNVDREAPPSGDEVAHFLVPAREMWNDVVHTCANQRLFCNEACVDAWLMRTAHPRGYVMDLATLWRLASHWYDGRLDPGYQRREPAAAKEYFRSVGLRGEFWGL